MADAKGSTFTLISPLASGDKAIMVDVSDLSVSKVATMQEIRAFVRPWLITGPSGTLDPETVNATRQVLTSNNADIPTTTVVTQLTALTMDVGWWEVEYLIIWQSNVTSTGITFTVDHTGTAANFQFTREDMVGSTTSLATVGVASQASAQGVTGALPSNWSVRSEAAAMGPSAGVDVINVNQYTRITGLLLVTAVGNLLLRANSEIASTITRVCAGTMASYARLS